MPKYCFVDHDAVRLNRLHQMLSALFSDFDPKYSSLYLSFDFHHGSLFTVRFMDILVCFISSYGDLAIKFSDLIDDEFMLDEGFDSIVEAKIKETIGALDSKQNSIEKSRGKLRVKSRVTKLPFSPVSRKMVLPVGSAIFGELDGHQSVIYAPIYEAPRRLKFDALKNVYYAMLAVLEITKEFLDECVIVIQIIPDSETEIVRAFRDLIDGRKVVYPTGIKVCKSDDYYLVTPTFTF